MSYRVPITILIFRRENCFSYFVSRKSMNNSSTWRKLSLTSAHSVTPLDAWTVLFNFSCSNGNWPYLLVHYRGTNVSLIYIIKQRWSFVWPALNLSICFHAYAQTKRPTASKFYTKIQERVFGKISKHILQKNDLYIFSNIFF